MRGSRNLLPIAAALALAAGCGSGSTTTTSATTKPSATTATTTSPVATTASLNPSPSPTTGVAAAWSTSPVSVPGQGETALLVGVRAAAQNGFDRVTFEFANHLPGYAVQYVERPILQDGSGTEVAVDGGATLAVQMRPASSYDLSAGGGPTYTGPKRIRPATSTVVEVVQVGDFEGILSWVAGVGKKAGFKVSTLGSPPRLVVDITTG